MAIIYQHPLKRKKRKPSAEEQKLRKEWERLLQTHSKPLEGGKKVRGSLPKAKPVGRQTQVLLQTPMAHPRGPDPKLPSLPMGLGGTKMAIDPLAGEKHALKTRVGQVFNKGGPQYLSDDDIAEQRTGSHKRR